MIIRTIIYLAITIFFLKDIKRNYKPFKRFSFPIIAITYFGGTKYFINSDNRIQLTIHIITAIMTVIYVWGYYKDFKIERYKNKKKLRENRDKERILKDEAILKNILEAKNSDIKQKSRRYEITMDMPKSISQISGQLNLFNDSKEELFIYEDEFIEDNKNKSTVLENQMEIFEITKE